ncbi:TPR repeat-containing protein [Nitrosotalea devaniterrae]|uniref:TPR repeat-containing protein n=1 Tax=Nitrosotalea devaniterrae TaxID=1078905 RepID=A0A128A3A4_9ARCH|nr:TPR repeat-containing protein [Candidatus Nitrosotalea devanaterra]
MEENILDLVKKGSQFILDGDFEKALSYFEQAIIITPNDPNLLNKKGVALRGLGRYDEALECFNKSLQLDPRDLDSS